MSGSQGGRRPLCGPPFFCLLSCAAAPSARAADCPGHPEAIGTSRTLVVDPREHHIIGTMQYAKTLPLADHEVVLTFDDGPLPKYSYQILDILAAQCVKATFFLVGRQANANPEGVRKVRDAGHTVATHTQNHPGNMNRLPIDRAQKEIEDGIASVTAALADGTAPAPFFRIPGLGRSDVIEEYAEAKGIQVWSADFPADDWRHVSSQRVYDLAIQRLEAKGKGILLLHDIQARTVAALPRILHELKARGYRIVHVVPATSERPATPDRTATMAIKSGNRDGGDVALAEDSEFCLCGGRIPSRAGAIEYRVERYGPEGPRAASRLARRTLVAAGDAGAGPPGAAGSGGKRLQAPGIRARHDAVFAAVRATGGTHGRGRACCGSPRQTRRAPGRQVAPSNSRRGATEAGIGETGGASPRARGRRRQRRRQTRGASQAGQEEARAVRVAGLKKR